MAYLDLSSFFCGGKNTRAAKCADVFYLNVDRAPSSVNILQYSHILSLAIIIGVIKISLVCNPHIKQIE